MSAVVEFLLARIAEDERDRCPCRFVDEDRDVCDARWTAECEAKRRIIPLHVGTHECPRDPAPENDLAGLFGDDDPCPTLRALSAAYADHPDYRDEWRLDRVP